MWQDLLFSYNIAVDRTDEMKRILGKSAASVGLQLPDVYKPCCGFFFFFFFMSFIFTILWRIVAFVVVWLLGCCIFPFAFNSFAVDQVEPRFYTLVSQLDTKKLSCVVWAGCWNNELIYKLWYWKIRREKDFWKLTYLNIIISWWSLNGILEETIHIMMFNFMLAVMNGFLITH